MIRTADTPGFAGNRVGFKVLNEAAQLAEEYGPVLVERLVGPYTGRALTRSPPSTSSGGTSTAPSSTTSTRTA